MSTVEALDRVIRGKVVAYPVTVVEGLTLRETAERLASRRLRRARRVSRRDGLSPALIADLDPAAEIP